MHVLAIDSNEDLRRGSRQICFTYSSELATDPQTLLARQCLASVNTELSPFKMSAPPDWRHKPITQWPVQKRLFHSWILLFGFLPLDRHSFRLQRIRSDGFDEASTSIINRAWRHQRTIDSTATGCCITDTLCYECRLPLLGILLQPLYRLVFKRRHRYLRRHFGTPTL